MEKNPKLREQLIREMYRQSFYNPCITMDMVGACFEPNNMCVMDDELSSQLLDVGMIEYCYDKDINLFKQAYDLLNRMVECSDDKAKVRFYVICFEEMLKNISYEFVYALQQKYEELENDNLEKKLMLVPLFKNALPKYICD